MAKSVDNQSVGDLLTGLVGDISSLFRKEINLAKTEASEKMSHALTGIEAFAAGLVFAIGAVGVLLAALVSGLAAVLVAQGFREPTADAISAIVREIEEDRRRISERIDAIQQRLSPGQLLDEALSYAKSNGGSEFASNLTTQVKANPIPTALLGVSLAWLMAGSKSAPQSHDDEADYYPLATIEGDIRRTGPVQTDGTSRYSHFTDAAGKRFKALTDETGRRAGHFMDDSGRTFRGFADASGRQIHDIRDEAGKLFDEASGWVAKTWRRMGDAGSKVGQSAMGAGRSSVDMGADLFNQASQLNQSIMKGLRDQPLIGGALAFAVGAALGATLPRTKQEDELMGEMADKTRNKLSAEASRRMDQAEHIASDAYKRTAAVAADVYDEARQHIVQEAKSFSGPDGQSEPRGTRPH
eukprot:g9886.t1